MMVEEVARFFNPWGAAEAQQQAMPQGEAIGACSLLPALLMPSFAVLQDRHSECNVVRCSRRSQQLLRVGVSSSTWSPMLWLEVPQSYSHAF